MIVKNNAVSCKYNKFLLQTPHIVATHSFHDCSTRLTSVVSNMLLTIMVLFEGNIQ
jgi:hypothetical protein